MTNQPAKGKQTSVGYITPWGTPNPNPPLPQFNDYNEDRGFPTGESAQYNKRIKHYYMRRGKLAKSVALDEDDVRTLIQDARDDWRENLLEPLQGYISRSALTRHHRRFIQVIGQLSGMAELAKPVMFFLSTWGVLTGVLFWEDSLNYWIDGGGSMIIALLAGIIANYYLKYRSTFVKIYCIERADFTDISQVTGLVTIHLPRLVFFLRPDIWRGNNGKNGIRDGKAYVVLQAGRDTMLWHQERIGDWDLDEWCDVRNGPMIANFRNPPDYYYLPGDPFTATGTSMKHRRAWCRQLQRNGTLMGKIDRGALSFLDGKWMYIIAGIGYLFAFLAFTLASG